MAVLTPVNLETESRFKDTDLLVDSQGVQYWSPLWIRPTEIAQMVASASTYRLAQSDVGRLDIIAYKTLGDSKLWWIIAALNQIIEPISEMVPGTVILIPDQTAVMSFTSRGPIGNNGTSS